MSRGCTICKRADVEMINADRAAGMSFIALCEKYKLASGTVSRHFQHTLIAKPNQVPAPTDTVMTSETLKTLYVRADKLYKECVKKGDRLNAIRAAKELRDLTELALKVSGELNSQKQQVINYNHVQITPEWALLRAEILKAIDPYPDAKRALIRALNANLTTGENNDAIEARFIDGA